MSIIKPILRKIPQPLVFPVIGVPFRMGGGSQNWSTYWATRTPSTLALTQLSLTSIRLDWLNTGDGYDGTSIERSTDGVTYAEIDTVASGVVTYTDSALTSAEPYYRVRCFKGTNYSPYSAVETIRIPNLKLTATGDGTVLSRIVFRVSVNITATILGSARFYSDAAGTLDESTTWNIVAGANRTMYVKLVSGDSHIVLDLTKITSFGDGTGTGWDTSINSPKLTFRLNELTTLSTFRLSGDATITGKAPATITYFRHQTNEFAWTNSDNFESNLCTYFRIESSACNWTGFYTGSGSDMATFILRDYRQEKMTSADMITFLNYLTARTGTMPAAVTINDYADYASPPAGVVAAVDALKTAKSITTVNLGA